LLQCGNLAVAALAQVGSRSLSTHDLYYGSTRFIAAHEIVDEVLIAARFLGRGWLAHRMASGLSGSG
jgi:hypothetical protein